MSLMCECLYYFSAGWDRGEYIRLPVSLMCECLYCFNAGMDGWRGVYQSACVIDV